MKRIYIGSDGDGHNYIIPHSLSTLFNYLLEEITDEENQIAIDAFEEKFNKYRIEGDINNVELFANIE